MKTKKELALIAIKGHRSISYITKGEQDAFEYLIQRLHDKGASGKYLQQVVKRVTGIK